MTSTIRLNSGDVILYEGSHPMHLLHQRRTGCRWGQVGMIVNLPNVGHLCVAEATKASECTDIKLHQRIEGVQCAFLTDRLRSFDGQIAFRRLTPALPESRSQTLLTAFEQLHGLPFNDSKWIALRALRRKNPSPSLKSFFCSELVAYLYQSIGLLSVPPSGEFANNYLPADFNSSYDKSIVRLEEGFRLTKEIEYTWGDAVEQ